MRERLSFANVTSVVALFVALGGGAYALEKNSIDAREIATDAVKSKEIKNSSVKGKDVKADTLTAAQIASGAIAGSELADGAVTALELANGAVGAPAILDGAVASAEVLDGALTGVDIDNDSLTGADVNESTLSGVPPIGNAGGDLDGTYPNPTLGGNTVGPTQLDNDSVGPAEQQVPPHLRVEGTVQTVPDGIVTPITFGTPETSSDITWDNTTDTAEIQTAGLYLIGLQATWADNAAGRRVITVLVNGTSAAGDSRLPVAPPADTTQSVSTLQELPAGADVTATGQQTSGGNLGIVGNGPGGGPALTIHWVGPAD